MHSRPLGSLSSPYFYGTSDRFRDSLYDVDHHVSEVDCVGSLAVFLYDSDVDGWMEEKDDIESDFDHHDIKFSQWELCLRDYKIDFDRRLAAACRQLCGRVV